MFSSNDKSTAWQLKRSGLVIVMVFGLAVALGGCSESPTTVPDADPEMIDLTKGPGTKINCQGTKCTQPGEAILPGYLRRHYSYIVTPGANGVTRVDIGIDHAWYQLTGMVMPNGWSYTIINGDQMPHNPRQPAAPHGHTRNINGTCNAVIRWTSNTPLYAPFQLAYNWNGPPHVVEWDTSDLTVADWTRRIGKGVGPVHAPKIAYVPGDVVGIDPVSIGN